MKRGIVIGAIIILLLLGFMAFRAMTSSTEQPSARENETPSLEEESSQQLNTDSEVFDEFDRALDGVN